MDSCPINETGDAVVDAVTLHEVLDEQQEHLPAHNLIAMHVANILELGLEPLVNTRVVADLQDQQITPLNRLTNRVEASDVGIFPEKKKRNEN